MTNTELLCMYAEQAYMIGQKEQEFRRVRKPGEFFLSLPKAVSQ